MEVNVNGFNISLRTSCGRSAWWSQSRWRRRGQGATR